MNKTITSPIKKLLLSIFIFLLTMQVSTVQVWADQKIQVVIDGQKQIYDQSPLMINDRVLVPLRGIFEALGTKVVWDEKTQSITCTNKRQQIILKVGSKTAFVNGSTETIDPPPKIINGRTLVPIRAISEIIGANVNWDGVHNTVQISTQNLKLADAVLDGNVIEINSLLEKGVDPNSEVTGITELSVAARYGKIESVKALLKGGANPNIVETDGWSPLLSATLMGTSSVKSLLTGGADPNAIMKYGDTALTFATYQNKTEMVQALLEAGANPNVKVNRSEPESPLFDAINVNNIEMVKSLLSHGADPNSTLNGMTGLMYAASFNNLEMLKALLAGGADPNYKDEFGWTALMVASEHGNPEAVQALLDGHADPNVLKDDGASALKIAKAHGNFQTVDLLTKAGAKELPTAPMDISALIRTYIQDDPDWTPLMQSAARGDLVGIRTLIKNGVDPNLRTHTSISALDLAIRYGYTEAAKELLAKGAKPIQDRNDYAWRYAINSGNIEVIKAIMPYYTEYDHAREDGNTALMTAAASNDTALATLLLDKGVNPNTRNSDGITALMAAAQYGNHDAVVTLMNNHADPNIRDNEGRTALEQAVINEQPKTVDLLLELGANPNIKDKNGKTALFVTVEEGNAELVASLLDSGSDPNSQSNDGISPLSYALEKGYGDIEALLIKMGAQK